MSRSNNGSAANGRPHKLTEQDRRVLKRIKCVCPKVATLTTKFQTASGSNVSTRTVRRELHEMGFHVEQPHTILRLPCAMPKVGWSHVKLTAIGLWSSGNASGVMNHASPSGSPTDKSGDGRCQENASCPQ